VLSTTYIIRRQLGHLGIILFFDVLDRMIEMIVILFLLKLVHYSNFPYTTPGKKARTGKGANATLGVTVDSIPDDASEHPRGEDIPPATTPLDSTTPASTTPIPTPTKGAVVQPPAPASSPGVSDADLRGAIQMLTQIVASQT